MGSLAYTQYHISNTILTGNINEKGGQGVPENMQLKDVFAPFTPPLKMYLF